MANEVTAAASLVRSVAQADWPNTKVHSHTALVLHSSDEMGELSQWQ